MNWILPKIENPQKAELLAKKLSTHTLFPIPLASILVQRGIDTFEKARAYFAPGMTEWHDPFLMKDMDRAVERLLLAKENNEKILIYGDYDVDGTTAVTLMCLFCTEWGLNFDYYIPDRYAEGYGISFKGIDFALESGASLIIALDCGIKAVEKVRYANLKGIDFIICDHHTPGPELPPAIAVLDPKRADCDYPNSELPGCGLGLKLAEAFHQRLIRANYRPAKPEFSPFEEYCDLTALSIACDIVPLTGENRMIAWHGLEKLRKNPSAGIHAIKSLSDKERDWDISDLVFFIGPRVNAAGRIGSGKDAVEVMLGHSGNLDLIAQDLHDSNDVRKDLDKKIFDEAMDMIAADPGYPSRSTTVLYRPDWHKGVIGIVASRLIERHYRPTVLLSDSDGFIGGSARSVSGFDLYAALEACEEHLAQFGGHKYAAGLKMKADSFAAFRDQFDAVVSEAIRPEQKVPSLCIDHELDFSEIDARLIRILKRMEPFGPQNMEPVFMTREVEVIDARILKEAHLRLRLRKGDRIFDTIGFNMAHKWIALQASEIDIAFQPMFNSWNGNTTIRLRLKDIKNSNGKSGTA